MEGNGVHGPGVNEQNRHIPGVDHGVASQVFDPGMDPGVLIDEQSVTEQSPLLEQVVDNIPGQIHQFVDCRLNSWSRHRTMVLPGTDSLVDDGGRVLGAGAVAG